MKTVKVMKKFQAILLIVLFFIITAVFHNECLCEDNDKPLSTAKMQEELSKKKWDEIVKEDYEGVRGWEYGYYWAKRYEEKSALMVLNIKDSQSLKPIKAEISIRRADLRLDAQYIRIRFIKANEEGKIYLRFFKKGFFILTVYKEGYQPIFLWFVVGKLSGAVEKDIFLSKEKNCVIEFKVVDESGNFLDDVEFFQVHIDERTATSHKNKVKEIGEKFWGKDLGNGKIEDKQYDTIAFSEILPFPFYTRYVHQARLPIIHYLDVKKETYKIDIGVVGTYYFLVKRAGFVPAIVEITPEEGKTVETNVIMRKGVTLTVKVVDANDKPCSYEDVLLLHNTNNEKLSEEVRVIDIKKAFLKYKFINFLEYSNNDGIVKFKVLPGNHYYVTCGRWLFDREHREKRTTIKDAPDEVFKEFVAEEKDMELILKLNK